MHFRYLEAVFLAALLFRNSRFCEHHSFQQYVLRLTDKEFLPIKIDVRCRMCSLDMTPEIVLPYRRRGWRTERTSHRMVRAWRLLCVFSGLPQIKLTKILAARLLL